MGPKVFSSRAGQRIITENTGVKRIAGTDLLLQGKIPEWQYYLLDIQSTVVFANTGPDVWVNGLGQPAAGSLAIRDSISPFEGYRFYVIEQDTSYEWIGGSWTGTVFDGNTLSATFIKVNGDIILARGRKYHVVADAQLTIPKIDDTANGNGASLFGHEVEIVVARGVTCSLVANGVENYITAAGAINTPTPLNTGNDNLLVFGDTAWELFVVDLIGLQSQLDSKLAKAANLSDVANAGTARANLDVFSKAESSADSDAAVDNQTGGIGITKTGNSSAGTVQYNADFASSVEALNNTIVDKAINPKTLSEVQQSIQRYSELIQRTGLVQSATETQFKLDRNAINLDTLEWDEFTVVFNPEPSTQLAALQISTIAASSIVVPNVAGVSAHFVTLNSSLVIAFSLTPVPVESVDIMLLGIVVLQDGDIADVTVGVPFIETIPWLGSSAWALRHATPIIIGGGITPNADVPSATIDVGAIERSEESINFAMDTSDAHLRTFPAVPKATWTYIDSTGLLVGPVGREDIDGSLLEGGTIASNAFGIQVVFVTRLGTFAILTAQVSYANLSEVTAAIAGYAPTIPAVLANAIELARMAVKGNQVFGGGQLDLTMATNFFTIQGTGVAGAGANNASNVISSTTNNTLEDTNVQSNLDELSNRTAWEFITGGGVLEISHKYIIGDSLGYTMPVMGAAREFVGLSANGGVTPTMTVDNVTAAEHFIKAIDLVDNGDTTFQIDAADNGKEYLAISNAIDWEM